MINFIHYQQWRTNENYAIEKNQFAAQQHKRSQLTIISTKQILHTVIPYMSGRPLLYQYDRGM